MSKKITIDDFRKHEILVNDRQQIVCDNKILEELKPDKKVRAGSRVM